VFCVCVCAVSVEAAASAAELHVDEHVEFLPVFIASRRVSVFTHIEAPAPYNVGSPRSSHGAFSPVNSSGSAGVGVGIGMDGVATPSLSPCTLIVVRNACGRGVFPPPLPDPSHAHTPRVF
jgi:hypothetical protein